MIKKSFKEQNAITLVALIITIIVLLILAMVSISLVMNSGIIDKSKSAVDKYSGEEIQEQLKLAYSEWQMSQYTGTPMTAQDIQTKLGQIFGAENVTDVSLANGKLTAKINGTTYEYDTATGTAGEKDTSLGGQVTSANYGDYINLGTSILSDKPADWRILYNDKNGHVYAILADYLPNDRKASQEDTKSIVQTAGLDTGGTYGAYSNTNRDTLLAGLNYATAWQSLIPEGLRSTCQVKGATTAEIIMASYNEKYGTSLAYTSYPYLRTNPSDSSSSIDTLYMPHPGSSDYNGCYGYWLASPIAGGTGRVWCVCFSGFVDSGSYNGTSYGVCPVVSLPSDIQVTKNGTVWTVVQ